MRASRRGGSGSRAREHDGDGHGAADRAHAWRTAEPGRMAGLWQTWPALPGAIVALDLELQPVQARYRLARSLG